MCGRPHLNRCSTLVRETFPDMVKGYLCPHCCGLSDDQRAVVLGRTGGSIAPALRSCSPEYRVSKFNRRSHGVFVSEMPIEEEEEEVIDEDASVDVLEDVEKFIKRMTRVTSLWTKTKSERCWRLRGNKNDKKFQKRDFVEGLENRGNRRTKRFHAGVEELKL